MNTIQPIFKGETIYLIGGGPSLSDFNFNLLKDKNTIAINKAFLHVPNADVCYWNDSRFYTWFKKHLDPFKGLKITNKFKPEREDIIRLKSTGKTGLELEPTGLRHGNNSGYAAINLAYHLGANRIILLGYDMGTIGHQTHYHNGYNSPRPDDAFYKRQMMPQFETLVEPLKEQGVEILNANLNSSLECFPKIDLKMALDL